MPRLSATTIELSEAERIALEKLLNRNSTAQQIALRAKIILAAANGSSHGEVVRSRSCHEARTEGQARI